MRDPVPAAVRPGWASGPPLAGLPRQGEPDDELAPLAGPVAPGLDAPAVHLGQLLDDGQADAQAPLRPGQRAVALGEEPEHLRQLLGRDADPVVPDADDDLLALPPGGEPDPAAALGVLRGVGQQVQDDLLDPRRVDVERQLAPLDRDAQGVPPLVDERPGRLDRLVEDRARVDEVLPEPDLAAGDPGDVEQVVDEPDELPDLPLDDVARPSRGSPRRRTA